MSARHKPCPFCGSRKREVVELWLAGMAHRHTPPTDDERPEDQEQAPHEPEPN